MAAPHYSGTRLRLTDGKREGSAKRLLRHAGEYPAVQHQLPFSITNAVSTRTASPSPSREPVRRPWGRMGGVSVTGHSQRAWRLSSICTATTARERTPPVSTSTARRQRFLPSTSPLRGSSAQRRHLQRAAELQRGHSDGGDHRHRNQRHRHTDLQRQHPRDCRREHRVCRVYRWLPAD